MHTYKVTHLQDGCTFDRPDVYLSPHLDALHQWPHKDHDPVRRFHATYPDYAPTSLRPLTALASELGLHKLYLKDESTRFDLPAFKVLGASWALHKFLCRQLALDPGQTSFPEVQRRLANMTFKDRPRLVTCTVGNWGRAVARVARYLGLVARIYVPGFTVPYTQDLIRSEGAELVVLEDQGYDECVQAVLKDAEDSGAYMLQDVSYEGYEEFPAWVTEGYGTMLGEIDEQVPSHGTVNMVFVGVGGGALAQAVVEHYKAKKEMVKIVSVEADTAAGFKESLHVGKNIVVQSGKTIMNGYNSGTTSTNPWPVLFKGIDMSTAVTDNEVDAAVHYLSNEGIDAGPCGAATVASLRKVVRLMTSEERQGAVIVLLSTEGYRKYPSPT